VHSNNKHKTKQNEKQLISLHLHVQTLAIQSTRGDIMILVANETDREDVFGMTSGNTDNAIPIFMAFVVIESIIQAISGKFIEFVGRIFH
jgi:hypothetical protein